ALERLHEAGLLAADVRARAAVHVHLEADARAEDARAEQARRARLRDRRAQVLVGGTVLAAHVDVGGVDVIRDRRDEEALDQEVRVALEALPILERAGLALVGVARDVARPAVVGRHERPLHAGREARAAPTPQARR